MASITVPAAGVTLRRPTQTLVEAGLVAGDYRLVEFASCAQVTHSALPGLSQAGIRYAYGEVLREARSAFASFRPVDLRGRFVRVRSRYAAGGEWITRFAGYCPVEVVNVFGDDNGSAGQQSFTAYGIEYLLDRRPIVDSVWFSDSEVQRVRGVLSFNDSIGGRPRPNRSAEKKGDPQEYVFSNAGSAEFWSAGDILRYVLAWHLPEGCPPVVLSGDTTALDVLFPTVRYQATATVLQIANSLISPMRGLVASLRWTGVGPAELLISTTTEADIAFAGFSLPANRAIYDLNLQGRDVDDATVQLDERQRVGEVIVRGGAPRVCFTLGVREGNLSAGWTSQAELAYRNAGNDIEGFNTLSDFPAVQASLADNQRRNENNDAMRDVFRKFILSTDWSWEQPERTTADWHTVVVDGVSGPEIVAQDFPAMVLLPVVAEDGFFDLSRRQPVPERVRRFLRDTCVFRGWDYSVDPPVFRGVGDAESVEPIMVWAEGDMLVDDATVTRMMYDASAGGGESDLPTANVTPLEDELALYIDGKPAPHSFASSDFFPGPASEIVPSPNANPSGVLPRCDWRRLLITVAVETPDHVEMRRAVPGVRGGSVLQIDIPEATLWWIAPGTVVGVSPSGLPLRVQKHAGVYTRNDTDWLRAVMVMALGWYGRFRKGVEIVKGGVGDMPLPGAMVGNVATATGRSVGSYTVVSNVTYDFERNLTTMRTDFQALDTAGVVQAAMSSAVGGRSANAILSARAAAGSSTTMQRGPVRWSSGRGSGSGSSPEEVESIVLVPVLNFFSE